MKKRFLFVLLSLVLVISSCLFAGCNTKEITVGFMSGAESDVEYVNIPLKDYDGKMLNELLAGEEALGAKLTESEYGFYLTEINGMKPEANQYIAVFTNLEEFKDTSEYAHSPIEKDGVRYFAANVGISGLPVQENAKYMFVLLSF